MTSNNFDGDEFPLYKLYMLLTRILPENEHEELRGEMEESYWELIRKHHSKTDAMLRTSWQALMFVTGICFDNAVVKTGSFKEEALRLKDFLSKLYGILCLLFFPVLYFTPKALILFILLTFFSINYLLISLEWTFNHKNTLKFFGAGMALFMIASLLVVFFNSQQQQIFSVYMTAIGVTPAPWLTTLTVLALVTKTMGLKPRPSRTAFLLSAYRSSPQQAESLFFLAALQCASIFLVEIEKL